MDSVLLFFPIDTDCLMFVPFPDWDSGRGGYGDPSNAGNIQRSAIPLCNDIFQ